MSMDLWDYIFPMIVGIDFVAVQPVQIAADMSF